jgi:hypothetical protein
MFITSSFYTCPSQQGLTDKQYICIISRAFEVQAILDFRTTRPFIRYKFSPLIRLSCGIWTFIQADEQTFQAITQQNWVLNTILCQQSFTKADPSGHMVLGVGVQLLTCWDCGFESRRVHGCPSLVSVMCSQAQVYATGWSLVQRSPTERCLYVITKPRNEEA